MKPKHHYLLHYPDMMLAYGPLQKMWCMRFEAKHYYFKKLVPSTKCFKNVPSTLANRHQLMQAANASGNNFLRPDTEIANCTDMHFDTLNDDVQAVLHEVGITSDSLQITNSVQCSGIEYRSKMVVVVGFSRGEPLFGEIKLIIADSSDIRFIVQMWYSVPILQANAYQLTERLRLAVMKVDNFVDYYPLTVYMVNGKKMVVFKHLGMKEYSEST